MRVDFSLHWSIREIRTRALKPFNNIESADEDLINIFFRRNKIKRLQTKYEISNFSQKWNLLLLQNQPILFLSNFPRVQPKQILKYRNWIMYEMIFFVYFKKIHLGIYWGLVFEDELFLFYCSLRNLVSLRLVSIAPFEQLILSSFVCLIRANAFTKSGFLIYGSNTWE